MYCRIFQFLAIYGTINIRNYRLKHWLVTDTIDWRKMYVKRQICVCNILRTNR